MAHQYIGKTQLSYVEVFFMGKRVDLGTAECTDYVLYANIYFRINYF